MLDNGLEIPSKCSISNTFVSQKPAATLGSQFSFSTAKGTSASGTTLAGQSLKNTATTLTTSTENQSPATTSASIPTNEILHTDQSPDPSKQSCTCSCKFGVPHVRKNGL